MSSRSKNADRLSLLPDELLSHILSLMPTKSAVQTSTLSKRWRYTWTLSAHLDFDFDHIHCFHHKLDINCVLKIVNGILELCKTSQVKLLRLGVGSFSVPNSVLLRWINEAVRLNVCELHINARQIELPHSLFTCNTLTTLRLYASNKTGNLDVFNVPSNVKLLGLKTLEIYDPSKPSVSALRIIHGCPVLESLSLQIVSRDDKEEYDFNIPTLKRLILSTQTSHSDSFNKVVLNVPNLEYLSFFGGLSLLFVMEDLSSLVEAKVSISNESSNGLMAELLKGISGVKSLWWFSSTADVFSNAPNFPNLNHLDVRCSPWFQIIQILERCSELEHLCIHGVIGLFLTFDMSYFMLPKLLFPHVMFGLFFFVIKQKPGESCWIEPQVVPSCMVSKLRTMNITNWQVRNCDIEFLEYILGNAEVLKKLTITCSSYMTMKDKKRCSKLLKFPRASSSCEIHFVGPKRSSPISILFGALDLSEF